MRLLQVAFAVAASLTENAAKARPMMKVVKMLEDMNVQLNAEMEDDHEVWEKLDCWCKTNKKEKTASIRLAKETIMSLESTIKELAGAIAEGRAKLIKVKNEYNKDWDALKTATELRMKEASKFAQSEKDMLQVIDACKQAVIVLSKHNPELVEVHSVARALNAAQVSHEVVKPEERLALQKFLNQAANAGNTAFLSIPGYQSHASQSGQVFGILKQMQSDFESNLKDMQKEEQDARKAFSDLKKAKEEQMAAGRKQQSNYEEELAENLEKKAQAEENLHDTEEQLANDSEFLAKLQTRCATEEEEYTARVASRQEEIQAVTETIQILDNDEAYATATRSLPKQVAFLQLRSTVKQQQLDDVLRVLSKYVKKDPRIALIAMSVNLDAFTKVKKAIDDMIAQLQAEKKDEIKHRDFCIAEFNKNEREQNATEDRRDDLQVKIDQLKSDIKTLTGEIDALQAEIKEMQVQMQFAGENREKENAEFQATVQDQRVMTAILQKARMRMAQKYEFFQEELEGPGGRHTQTSATKTDPGNGPARFDKYKHSGDGGRVITMLDRIIADSQHYEKEQIAHEQKAQDDYEGFIDDSNHAIKLRNKSIANKSESRAVANENLTISQGDHAQAMNDLENLHNYKGELHGSCDFVMKNFEVRQEARDDEVKSLREAKDILSGMQGTTAPA